MLTLKRWLEHIGGLLFLALFVVFILQIGARFLFNQPLPWTDEMAVVLYVWVIFWASAFMVPATAHVSVDVLVNRFPPSIRAGLHTLGQLMLGGLALWALPASWDYVWFMRREATAVMGLPLFWVFLPLLVALVMLVLKAIHSAWQLAQTLRSLP